MYLFNSQQESKCISLDVKLDLTIEYRTLANSSGSLHLCYWGQNFSSHSLHGQYLFFWVQNVCMFHLIPWVLTPVSLGLDLLCAQRSWRKAAQSTWHFWRGRWRQWETSSGVPCTATSCSSTSARCPQRLQQSVLNDTKSVPPFREPSHLRFYRGQWWTASNSTLIIFQWSLFSLKDWVSLII